MGSSPGYWRRSMRAGRAVNALRSPIMGGVSKWNILRDTDIASRIPVFGRAPEVVTGVLSKEVQQVGGPGIHWLGGRARWRRS
jgi:hypothetical protein